MRGKGRGQSGILKQESYLYSSHACRETADFIRRYKGFHGRSGDTGARKEDSPVCMAEGRKGIKMKKKRYILVFVAIWVAVLVLFLGHRHAENLNKADVAAFMKDISIIQNDDKVGADIWLKQAIHGVDGIVYRYVVKTDCDKWDFETRYMTDTPIEWADGETSAVEVVIYSVQVRYNGTIYASGTYYEVPILNNLSSEIVSFDEWKQKLIKQAYQTYTSESKSDTYSTVLKVFLVLIPLLAIIYAYALMVRKCVKKYESKAVQSDRQV